MKKKEMKKKIIDFFTYSGATREEYEEIREGISEKNNYAVKTAVLIAFLQMALQLVLSMAVPAMNDLVMWYIVGLAALAAFRAWVYHRETWKIKDGAHMRKSNKLFCFVFLSLLYIFAIVLGTVLRTDLLATAFPVLLCVAPLLFMEMPWKMSLYLGGVTVVFCSATWIYKSPRLAQIDSANAVCSLVLVTIIYANIMHVKIHDMNQKYSIVKSSERDGLTRLLRKKSAEEEIRKYMLETGEPAVMLVLDVDNFKSINDVYGHTFGDVVLRALGECISDAFREADIKGRFGGDEFVVFLTHLENREVVVKRVDMLMELIKNKIIMPDNGESLHASVGIALYPEQACTYEELFNHADEALYQSKNSGKNCYTFYLDKPCTIKS